MLDGVDKLHHKEEQRSDRLLVLHQIRQRGGRSKGRGKQKEAEASVGREQEEDVEEEEVEEVVEEEATAEESESSRLACQHHVLPIWFVFSSFPLSISLIKPCFLLLDCLVDD